MEKGKIVFRLFVPAHQDTPKAIHPRVSALHHPAPSFLACYHFDRLRLLTPRPNMGGAPKLLQDLTDFLIVVAFVQAHALRVLGCWRRMRNHEALERRPHQLHIMPVGAIHRQPHGDAVALGQQTTLDPAFGTVGGIWPGFFPLQAEPWSLRRPCSASSSRSPAVRQTVPPPLARGPGKRPLRPRPETGRGRWIWH